MKYRRNCELACQSTCNEHRFFSCPLSHRSWHLSTQPGIVAHLPGHGLRKLTDSAHLRVDNERAVPLCLCVFFEHVLFHRVRGRRTPEVGTGRNVPWPVHCSEYVVLVIGSYTACRIDFVFPRRRLTHLCRKLRAFLAGGWLHICVRSRASGQNSSSYRRLRPNWLLNSTSFVDVPGVTVMAFAVCQGCTATFLAKTTPPAN